MLEVFQLRCICLLFSSATTTTTTATSPTTTRKNDSTLLTRAMTITTTTTKTNTKRSTSIFSTPPSNGTSASPLSTAKDDNKNMLVGYLAAGIAVLIVIGMSNLYSFLIATFKCFYANLRYKKKPLSCWK